jgi:hypothetical protein
MVKPPVLFSTRGKPPSSRRADPPPKSGVRAGGEPPTPKSIQRTPRVTVVNTIVSWRLPVAGAIWAPTLLLSVSMPCTEHQNLMGEAWKRAPLLELGVTVVNPSSRRALAPARWSPTCDPSVVPSTLQRFQLCSVWHHPGLQIAPERN